MTRLWRLQMLLILTLLLSGLPAGHAQPISQSPTGLPRIKLSSDGKTFVQENRKPPFKVWGFNYDHDQEGNLIEDYWHHDWERVAEDFQEMKQLGANVVRVHLQLGRFMASETEPNQEQLKRLRQLLRLAEKNGLYLDLTGLGCYHAVDVPEWYDSLTEARRWEVQATFWRAIAETCRDSSAVFCYDLMNEPVLPGNDQSERQWLVGEFGGKHFVQRIALESGERDRQEIALAWVQKMTAAIRKIDTDHLITVGVIPWNQTFPGAPPIFYSPQVAKHLDFVSIHLYPQKGKIDIALESLNGFQIGKPLLIEETSPLWSGEQEFQMFYDRTAANVDGYLGFYWGKTLQQYSQPGGTIADGIMKNWLQFFQDHKNNGTPVDIYEH